MHSEQALLRYSLYLQLIIDYKYTITFLFLLNSKIKQRQRR